MLYIYMFALLNCILQWLYMIFYEMTYRRSFFVHKTVQVNPTSLIEHLIIQVSLQ